jgi:hypothetical protein
MPVAVWGLVAARSDRPEPVSSPATPHLLELAMKRSNVLVLFTCSNCTADVSGGYSSAVEVRCPKCNYSEELRLEGENSPTASRSVSNDQGCGVRR